MWSIKEVTYLNKMFFYKLLDMEGEMHGLHLEPIGWQISGDELMENMMEHLHYNKNMYRLLKELEEEGRIEIMEIMLDYIGFFSKINTATLIRWKKI